MLSTPYHARIISLRCHPDDIDTLLSIYRSSSMPMVMGLPGLVLIAGVASSGTGQASSITVWETPEDRERGGISDESAANLSLYAPLMQGSYVRDAFDVPVFAMKNLPPDSSRKVIARITTEDIEPEHWQAATNALRILAGSMAQTETDEYGVMVFENRSMSRAMLIEFASSPDALIATSIRAREHRQTARSLRHLRRPPVTEHFDLIDLA